MANGIPNNYIKVNSFFINAKVDATLGITNVDEASDITDAEAIKNRHSTNGKILKSAFIKGVSKAVANRGKVIIMADSTQAQPLEKPSASTDSQTDDSSVSSSSSHESFNYSIFEAYHRMHKLNEADEDADNDNNSNTDSADNSSDNNSNYSSDNDSDQEDKSGDTEEETTDAFQAGPRLRFCVLLPNEGFTIWEILIDKNATQFVKQIRQSLISKKFKTAFNIASTSTNSDGLIPVSATTFLNPKAPCQVPFIGHCRYGFDAGSDETSEESQTICLAVAPIDGKTKKPKEAIVYKVAYNITGDIADGMINKLLDAASNSNNDYHYDQAIADDVSEFLHKKFKCVGDESMYDNFLKIRKYISSHLNNKSLEWNEAESETVKHYAKVIDLKKSFIYY